MSPYNALLHALSTSNVMPSTPSKSRTRRVLAEKSSNLGFTPVLRRTQEEKLDRLAKTFEEDAGGIAIEPWFEGERERREVAETPEPEPMDQKGEITMVETAEELNIEMTDQAVIGEATKMIVGSAEGKRASLKRSFEMFRIAEVDERMHARNVKCVDRKEQMKRSEPDGKLGLAMDIEEVSVHDSLTSCFGFPSATPWSLQTELVEDHDSATEVDDSPEPVSILPNNAEPTEPSSLSLTPANNGKRKSATRAPEIPAPILVDTPRGPSVCVSLQL